MRPLALLTRVVPGGLGPARPLVRHGLAALFGPPPFRPEVAPGDPGLFGPDSATWTVIGDPAAIVGGIRALLVQLLHPHAMAGVADHSSFEDDPLGRLQRTSGYVTTVAFGAIDEVLAVSHRVRAVHRRVAGTGPDGRPYRADDPHLLTWVSVALTSSFLAAYDAYGPRRITRPLADRFVAEQAVAAALLDPRVDLDGIAGDVGARRSLAAGRLTLPMLDDGTLPQNLSELEATLAAFRPELGITDEGRRAFRFLLAPPLDAPLRAAYLPMLAGALATLPPDLRELLERRRFPLLDRSLALFAGTIVDAVRLAAGPPLTRVLATQRVAAA